MKDKNLVLIFSDSEAFLRSEVESTIKKWGHDTSKLKHITSWNLLLSSSVSSLFGEKSIYHLDLTDSKNLKAFVELITKDKDSKVFKENWYGEGVIITSTTAKGTKKVENLVVKHKGLVVKKAGSLKSKQALLERLHIKTTIKKELSDFVGDSYEMLLPLVREVEKLDESKQKLLTLEQIFVMLPLRAGEVPPWEFITPMLAGDPVRAIELLDRALTGSHYLVALTFAKRKVLTVYRIRMLIDQGIRKTDEQAKFLGESNPKALWYTTKEAQRITIKTAEELAKATFKIEVDLKGGKNVDPILHFKRYVITVATLMKG